jgi:hypothetical protein
MKIKPTPICTFCDAQETIHHLVFNCPVVKPILSLLKRLVDYETNMTLPLKMESVVLGQCIEDRSLNYLIYCYKYYIYKCKLHSEMPRPQNFKLFIDQKLKAEEKKFVKSVEK